MVLPTMSKETIRYIVRIANNDLDGQKPVIVALQKIKGVGQSLANAVCRLSNVELNERLGKLSEDKITKLNTLLTDENTFPSWMRNRQKDYETGEDKHILSADLTFIQDNDLKRLKKIKSYRGLRNQWGLTVRGQRTKSNHRRSKAKKANISKKVRK